MLDRVEGFAVQLSDVAGPQSAAVVLVDEETRLLRLVRSDPPSRRDFVSLLEKGLPRPGWMASVLYVGISMFSEERAARARARPPTFLAEVVIPAGMGVCIAKTGAAHHFTVWGDADVLMRVAHVVDRIVL